MFESTLAIVGSLQLGRIMKPDSGHQAVACVQSHLGPSECNLKLKSPCPRTTSARWQLGPKTKLLTYCSAHAERSPGFEMQAVSWEVAEYLHQLIIDSAKTAGSQVLPDNLTNSHDSCVV